MQSLFPLKLFFKEKMIFWPFSSSVLLNAAIWLYLPFAVSRREEAIFLHSTIHFGVNLSGSWVDIFLLPLLGLFLIAINFFIAYFIYAQAKKLSLLVSFCTPALQLILLAEALFLSFLNP